MLDDGSAVPPSEPLPDSALLLASSPLEIEVTSDEVDDTASGGLLSFRLGEIEEEEGSPQVASLFDELQRGFELDA